MLPFFVFAHPILFSLSFLPRPNPSHCLTSSQPLSLSYLTPAPLLQERGYTVDYMCITLLLLKEKEMEDEVKNKEKEPEEEVKIKLISFLLC